MVQHSAIKMLASRVALIRDYVKAVEAGELPLNHEIIRDAQALASRLPVLHADHFQPQFYTQCNDAALMTLMGSIQKSNTSFYYNDRRLYDYFIDFFSLFFNLGCNNLMHFIHKYNVLHQRQVVSGRRMRGLFF